MNSNLNLFFENIGFFILFRMLPILLKNLVRSLKKFKNKFFENQKFEIKQKQIGESTKSFFTHSE